VFAEVIVAAGVRKAVLLSVFEVTTAAGVAELNADAEAVFVTKPAVTSAAAIVYVAVQVSDSPASRKLSPSPAAETAGQLTATLSSVTVTGPVSGADPLFVTK
jgi:hypothetical protein